MGTRRKAWLLVAAAAAITLPAAEAWIPIGTERVCVEREPPVRAGSTLDFQSRSVLIGESGPPWLAQAIATGRFQLDLRFMTYWRDQSGPAWIFAVSDDADNADLVVGQDGPDLVVRVRRDRSDADGTPEFRIPHVLAAGEPRHLRLVIERTWMTASVDGRVVRRVLLAGPPALGTWDAAQRVTIGDEEDGGHGWIGGVFEATVGDGAAAEALIASGALRPGEGIVEFDRPRVIDRPGDTAPVSVAVRLALFVPLGMTLVWLLRRPGLAVLAGVAFVLVLAAGKWFVPSRHPSAAEVVIGVVGVSAGVVVAGRRARPAACASPDASNLQSPSARTGGR
jgi:hypothetical protein